MLARRDAERRRDLPGLPVRAADIANLALGDQIVERAQRLVERRHDVGRVDLVEIDVIRLQPLQAGLDGVHDMAARRAHIVPSRPHPAVNLGRQDDVLASDAEILEGLAESPFGLASGVDVGRVEEIDPGIDAGFDERIGAGLVDVADMFVNPLAAAEGHRAEAKRRNQKAGVAEGLVSHRVAPCSRAGSVRGGGMRRLSDAAPRGCHRAAPASYSRHGCGRAPGLCTVCHIERKHGEALRIQRDRHGAVPGGADGQVAL